ncbi:hypothetical protein ZIOFF_067309 [Zingiber officinale]|uniref:Uncharacterized protein n=1 Tax=Zingiber officinale TaxID=94328 RepID=A0A8J5CX38_ZINOF|nr:hypothetical protein ZIOFF_067309 [Zingiber officinale]
MRLDKQTLFEQARRSLYCSRCNGLLLEVFSQIVNYGKSMQQEGSGFQLSDKAGNCQSQDRSHIDEVQDPSLYPWGGLTTTKHGILTVLDCFVRARCLIVLELGNMNTEVEAGVGLAKGLLITVMEDTVQADWQQSFPDAIGAYHHFEWPIGTGEGQTVILGFEDVGLNVKVQVTGLDLGSFDACYIILRAWKLDEEADEEIQVYHLSVLMMNPLSFCIMGILLMNKVIVRLFKTSCDNMDEKSSGISMNHETLELSDIEENSMLIMRLLHLNTQNHQDGNQDQGKIIFQIRHPNGCQKKGLQSIIIETAMLKKVRDQDRFDCQSSICNQLEDYSEKVRYHVSVSRLGKQINQNMQCICPGFGKGESGCLQHIGLESVSDVCSANHPTSFGKLATMMSCDPHVCQDNVDNFHIDTDVDCQDKLGLLIMKEYYSKNNIEDSFNHAKITSDPARSSSSSDNCFSCHSVGDSSTNSSSGQNAESSVTFRF